MERFFFLAGSVSGALAVLLGAFGAHALKAQLSADLRDTFETGVRYQMYHSFALVIVAFALLRWQNSVWLVASGWLLVAGIILFSGSLYLLAATNKRWLGAITPFGGLAFIAGWLCLAVGVWQAM